MILGAWIGILSQICEIFESRYLEKYAFDQHEIWRGIWGAQIDFVGGPALQKYNSRWRRPPSWIFAQTAITQPPQGMSDERQNRPILSADKIAPQKSVVCHAKNARFCRPTFRISDNKFCLCCHGDCLQRKMNIYFSYLLCLLFFRSLDAEKKWCKYYFAFACCAGWYRTK